jgi:DNA repair protein RecO (recombination protein O)
MYKTTTGLVLREVSYKESSKILTVLTESDGKITVSARGTKRTKSKTAAATQLLAFSEMTLFSRNGRWILTEAQSIELFSGLRGDLELFSLGIYFAELLESVSDVDSHSAELLHLGLMALLNLSGGKKDPLLVKAGFEMRLMSLSGYAPISEACANCGSDCKNGAYLDIFGGEIRCSGCAEAGREYAPLDGAALRAVRHVINSEPKRVFSFVLSGAALEKFHKAAEAYTLGQLDREFKTLAYYNGIKNFNA